MKKLVILTGAGISAESGLKTFRDADGLWEGHSVEDVATASAWKRNPSLVQEFYNQRRRQLLEVKPNKAHIILAELEKFFDVQIITQNVDDLHERAGSSKVLHLHGELLKMRSEADETTVYPVRGDIEMGQLAEDGHQLRPAIVFFEEMVPAISEAAEITATADIFVVVGTSLVVYPAAGLLHQAPDHAKLFVVDKHLPDLTRSGIYPIEKPATEGMEELKKILLQTAEDI